jgi:hypothetical protein
LEDVELGCDLKSMKKVDNIIPKNQGKPISQEERMSICNYYEDMIAKGIAKGKAIKAMQSKYERGKFSIKNIIDKHLHTIKE